MTDEKQPVYFTYKDRVSRLLFRDKHRLLEIYNALNRTNYSDVDGLTTTTLENAIYMKMKNDVSFVIDCSMCLYEHQSSYCPNMPLRGFLYLADLYKKYIRNADLSVSRRIKIPTPHYIVFYNGLEREEEEFVQKLSDSFEDGKEGCMELTVRIININYGHSKELMDRCRSLADYAYFVAEIRKRLEYMSFQEAVVQAVDICIEKNVLREFLLEQKAEVIAMSIYEYNEEYVRKVLMEDGEERGYTRGRAEGRAETVKTVRRMKDRKLDIAAMADLTGQEESYITEVLELLQAYPKESDLDIAKRMGVQEQSGGDKREYL